MSVVTSSMKAASTQEICIFCAYIPSRAAPWALIVPPIRVCRRRFNIARPALQQATAAVTSAEHGPHPTPPQWDSFASESSHSPSSHGKKVNQGPQWQRQTEVRMEKDQVGQQRAAGQRSAPERAAQERSSRELQPQDDDSSRRSVYRKVEQRQHRRQRKPEQDHNNMSAARWTSRSEQSQHPNDRPEGQHGIADEPQRRYAQRHQIDAARYKQQRFPSGVEVRESQQPDSQIRIRRALVPNEGSPDKNRHSDNKNATDGAIGQRAFRRPEIEYTSQRGLQRLSTANDRPGSWLPEHHNRRERHKVLHQKRSDLSHSQDQASQSEALPTRVSMPEFSLAESVDDTTLKSNWGAGGISRAPLQYGENTNTAEQLNPRDPVPGASRRETSRSQGRTPRNGATDDGQRAPPRSQMVGTTLNAKNWVDTTYQAAMLEPRDYQPSDLNSDHERAREWQHLKRRSSTPSDNSAKSQPSPWPLPSPTPQEEQTDVLSDDLINRSFNEHLEKRQASVLPQSASNRFTESPSALSRSLEYQGARRCARCGKVGHPAWACEEPPVLTTKQNSNFSCFMCGETGHLAKNCPKRATMSAVDIHDRIQPKFDALAANVTTSSPQANVFGATKGHVAPVPLRHSSYQDGREREDSRASLHGVRPVVSASEAAEPVKSLGPDIEIGDPMSKLSSRFLEEKPKRAKPVRRSRHDAEEDEDEDDFADAAREDRNARKAARKAQRRQEQLERQGEEKAARAQRRAEQGPPVTLSEFMSVAQLSQALGVHYDRFFTTLERLGYDDVFPGKILNSEITSMIAMEYGFEPVFVADTQEEADGRDLKSRPEVKDKELLPVKPPVVTIMGHVDHGKTTILDYLRKTAVAAGEAGGITQHIGAFSVPLASSGKTITFLDTPGHAAFLAMRQRGANVTDIVVLVVAADDSVKPQTLEAIKHAKAAGVPMIVAINKVDKEEADVQRVKQDLARHGVEIEDFGGDTQVVCVSGKTGQGMDSLEENVVTLSEILDHRADPDGAVEGWVLEATTKKAGRVATVLVRRGTLRPGAVLVAGRTWTRVRNLRNERDQVLQEVGPGMPVEVDGWRDQPNAGDEVLQAPNEQKASDVVAYRLEKAKREKTATDIEAINATRRLEMEKREQEEKVQRSGVAGSSAVEPTEHSAEMSDQPLGKIEVPFIIKADVSGSAEAVAAYILSLSSPLVAPRILHSAVGPVHESDVELAAAANGHIVAFNLPSAEGMNTLAASKGVRILPNNIIYRVVDDVKAVLEDKLPRVAVQKVLGEAEVGATFEIGLGGRKKVKVAGCKVRNGMVGRGSKVRVLRGEVKIYDGTISSLKNVKKDVQEMRKGTECGIGFENWEDFAVGDQIQTYEEISEKRRL